MSNIIIDFETGGYHLTGKVINVAFTHFDFTGEVESFNDIIERTQYYKFNYKAIDQKHFKFDETVIQWWLEQDKNLFKETFKNPEEGITLTEFKDIFTKYIATHFDNDCNLWCRGTSFDMTILDRIYGEGNFPVAFWRVRDIRSFIDAVNVMTNIPNNNGFYFSGSLNGFKDEYIAHDPIQDIAKDVRQLQMAYKLLTLVNKEE